MLALLGLVTVLVLLVLIMSRRVSPLAALVAVPTTAALAGGFRPLIPVPLTGLWSPASPASSSAHISGTPRPFCSPPRSS